ncbi:MAG: hypothetical protein JXQ83_03230 [Candidatus Glassbacteria bacterium]|nr:hypothetical protein [Candidatus Glassbacteria bacterium]
MEIAKILDEKQLEGDDLLEDLLERLQKSEIKAVQDKRLIFTRVRSYLEKVFGSYYTTEKKEPLVLIAQALVRMKQNPHLSARNEKIRQISNLMDTLVQNGLLGLKAGMSEERDYTVISQRLRVQVDGGQEKLYEIRRRIPSAKKAEEEEKLRLINYKEELKVIEQIRLTCKQVEGLVSQPLDDEIKQQAAHELQKYFSAFSTKMQYAHYILIGKGSIEDSFIAELKLESLDLAEEMKDDSLIDKMIFLSSLNWYRNQWASRSFNEPDNLVYFMVTRMINRRAPWNPKGNSDIRKSFEELGIACSELEKVFVAHATRKAGPQDETGSIKVDRRREKIDLLISQVVTLNGLLASRKSVEEGNTLLKKFLRPGIRTPISQLNMKAISEEIRSYVKMDCLSKFMRDLKEDQEISRIVARLRGDLSEGHMDLFQQLQAFRVAHGLSNLKDNKEREKLAAFISPADVVQFLSSIADGNLSVKKVTEDSVSFTVAGSTGEILDTSTRTLSRKGITYDEAGRYINKEFENLLLNYDKADFEARCTECNPGYEREKDIFVQIKQYAWAARRYPLLKLYFGGCLLLVSPIMYNLMEGEREKEEKTINQHTVEFMEEVCELIRYLLEKIQRGTETFEASFLDLQRVESHYVTDDSGVPVEGAAGGPAGGTNYSLLLEEGVREVFPKVNFELQVILEQSGEGFESHSADDDLEESSLTEEERAFEEKYAHLLIESSSEPAEKPVGERVIDTRSIHLLASALENVTVFYERLKAEGYERRIPVMRRDQIVSNVRDGCYFIRDILQSLHPEKDKEVNDLLIKTEKLLKEARHSIQQTEVIEEQINVEQENVEVPLYEIHSILVTLNSSYMVTLQGLIELISQKQLAGRAGLVKPEQINASRKIVDNIESALNTLIRNSRHIKLESPKIEMGLRDAMTHNIAALFGEINRLKRSQLIIQNTQHPNDLRIYLNVLARELLDRKLVLPLENIMGTIKKAPTTTEGKDSYGIWKPEGEEQISTSAFGRLEIPDISMNDAPKVLRSVIEISDALADHLKARGEDFREKLAQHKQTVPKKTNFDDYAERMTKNVSGILGQLHAFFVPDKENNITFDPENLDNIMRIIGTGVGELLSLVRDFNKNKAAFSKELEAIRKIAPALEGVRNRVNDYNQNYLKQKKSADLARSKTNCDKALIGFCQQLGKYDDPTTKEYKTLIIRGRVYLALENMVQDVLGAGKTEFNPERKKNYQNLVSELFYMMSHVNVEERDLPLFKKFMSSTLKAAQECGNSELGTEVVKLINQGEEVQHWLKVAESGFEASVIESCYKPGMDLDRLRKLGESV